MNGKDISEEEKVHIDLHCLRNIIKQENFEEVVTWLFRAYPELFFKLRNEVNKGFQHEDSI